MSIAKPPSFEELVKTYGTPKKAILHLIEAGFSPEQVEWKMGISYHSIRLYMEDVEPKTSIPFSKIAEVYELLAILRGKKGKETELAKFFQNPDIPLGIKARFALGALTEESVGFSTFAACVAFPVSNVLPWN
jgi:hypothetical protein